MSEISCFTDASMSIIPSIKSSIGVLSPRFFRLEASERAGVMTPAFFVRAELADRRIVLRAG
jgi:hypothetical protein